MSSSNLLSVVIGADVSQRELVLAYTGAQQRIQRIANTRKAILAWLKTLPAGCVIGMEATGRLHQLLADLAAAHAHTVYVVNPKHVAAYARSLGQRAKTDPLDAAVIARYVERERDRLHPYTPATALQRTLHDLKSQRAAVVRHATALKQSLKAIGTEASSTLRRANQAALKSLRALQVAIEHELLQVVGTDPVLAQQRAQLQTAPGIGGINSVALTHRFDRTPFANSDAVVAAYGMDPRPKDSGKHIGKRRLTKQGNAEDRRLIYLAAQAACKTKLFGPIYRGLLDKGFATTEAIVIIARKLLRIAFAIWTTGQPFDPNKVGKNACKKP